jgi:hypothetical protein
MIWKERRRKRPGIFLDNFSAFVLVTEDNQNNPPVKIVGNLA